MNPEKIGRYEIERELGQGGMAVVYLARDPYMKRQVAVKVLPREFTFDPQFRVRFQREAELIASLEHPNIVPVHDFGEHDGQPFIVMRHMTGGSLLDRLARGPLSLAEAARVVGRVADALDEAHARQIIHRDLKPGNILFDVRNEPYLSDFGIAKLFEATAGLTGTALIGTPEYMSPEQARGVKTLDGRSDVYSLGVVLFQTLTGQLPFKADTPMGVAMAQMVESIPSILTARPGLPPAIEAIITRALAKDPAGRYPNAGALARDLNQLVTGQMPGPSRMAEGATVLESPPPAMPPRLAPTSEPGLQSIPPVVSASMAAAPPVARPRRRPAWMWIAAGSGGLLLLCALVGGIALLAFPGFRNPFGAPVITSPAPVIGASTTPIATFAGTEPLIPTDIPPIGSSNIYVEYILDASGSMLAPLDGKTRLAIAQEVLAERVAALPPDIHVGLRVYGHRIPFEQEAESCEDIELIVPVEAGGAARIISWLPTMQALGMTPMSESIRQAAEDFTFDPGRNNSIILISDGIETCGDEPAKVALFLQELGIDFTIHVIGLDVDEPTRAQLQRLAGAGRGIYHDANSEQDLQAALGEINAAVVEALPVPTATLLPIETPIPEANTNATSEGTVQASTTFTGYPSAFGVDGDRTTSWFSTGPEGGGVPTTYQWTGVRDDLIASVAILSNEFNAEPSIRTKFGFETAVVQVLDAAGEVVFEESVSLAGTPDPDVTVRPGVVGRSVQLLLSGHEDPTCGGFSELEIGVVR